MRQRRKKKGKSSSLHGKEVLGPLISDLNQEKVSLLAARILGKGNVNLVADFGEKGKENCGKEKEREKKFFFCAARS